MFLCAMIAATAMLGGCSAGDEFIDEPTIDDESEALDEFSMDGTPTQVVRLKFNIDGVVGQPFPKQDNIPNSVPSDVSDVSDVKASVVKNDSGEVLIGKPPGKNGRSIDLPDYTKGAAVIKVVDTKGDALSPGLADFSFGADFNLNKLNSGPLDDNGNNLIQRGLHNSGHQYKIQVDKGEDEKWRPSCTLEKGTVEQCKNEQGDPAPCSVAADKPVEHSRWYRVTCMRQGTTLRLVVRPYNPEGQLQDPISTTERKNMPKFDLTWPVSESNLPMSIGGKLNADGKIVKSNDQFNGFIDNAFLTIFR